MNFSHRFFFDKSCNTLVGIKCILIVKNTHNCAMLKKINSKENIVKISEKETFSSFGLTNFSILFSVLREVEPFGTTLNSMKNQPGSQTTKKVRQKFDFLHLLIWFCDIHWESHLGYSSACVPHIATHNVSHKSWTHVEISTIRVI